MKLEFPLPEGWIWTTLGEICFKPKYGWTAKAVPIGKAKFLRTTDISNGNIDWSTVPYCDDIPTETIIDYQLCQFDIVISRAGSVGLSFFIDEKIDFPIIFASYLIRLRTIDPVLSKYIRYYLKSDAYWTQITDFTIGIAIPNVSGSKLEGLKIPLPPLNEQKRIIKKLDQIFSSLNNLKERESNIKLIEEQAVKYFLFDVNSSNKSIKLGDYCLERNQRIGDTWHGKRLIGVSNEHGITDLRVGGKRSFEKYKVVQQGDFVYNPMRVNIGSIAIWEEADVALTSPDYVVFSIEHTLSPLLVLKFFKSPWGLSEINKNTQGTVRSRLYFENLKNINFPFCGAAGQGQAESVLTRFKEINDQVYLVQSKMKVVLNDTLNKTFRGELVTHNKDDEHAQKFLDKIKRIKSSIPAKKSSKKTKTLSMRSNKPTLKDLIKAKFSGTEFSYKELATFVNSESELEYDELKDLFFNLLRQPINNTENKPYLVQKLTGEGQVVFQINTTS